MRDALREFNTGQFMKHQAPYIPEWVFEKACDRELRENWLENMKVVKQRNVPSGANIISSHFVYRVKYEHEVHHEDVLLRLKARLCVHGNKDSERTLLRTDAAVASHFSFRIM